MTILNHIRAVFALPFMVTIVIPTLLYYYVDNSLLSQNISTNIVLLLFILSILFLLTGLFFLIANIVMFAKIGKGTLAPWDPPKKLVVVGMYKYVRNPMITGVMFVLLAEFLFLKTYSSCIWAVVFIATCLIVIPLVEEKQLEKRFGSAYQVYKKQVPRWIPRFKLWNNHLSLK